MRPYRFLAWHQIFLLTACSLTFAADWTQFRGSNNNGISQETNLPAAWSDTENLKWKTKLPGRGSSSPVVAGDRIYVTCFSGVDDASANIDKLQRHLVAINRSSGKIVWDKMIPADQPEDPYQGFITHHGYASQTPAVDAERIYVFFGKTGVLAFNLDGDKIWQTNVGKESSQMRWGSGSSPILYKHLVIVNASDESQSLRALDRKTGQEIWRAEASGLEQIYGTPTLVELEDGKTELAINAAGELWGMDPDTGEMKWYAATNLQGQLSPSVVAGSGTVYTLGGRGGGVIAVKAGGRNDVTESHLLWTARGGSNVPTPVLVEGHLYWVDESGVAHCVDAKTGKIMYEKRLEGIASSGGPGSSQDRRGGGRPEANSPPASQKAEKREGTAPHEVRSGAAGPPGSRGPGSPGSGGRGRGGFSGGGPAVYASVVYGDGKIYAVTRRNGTFVIAAKPNFEQIAHNKFAADESQFNASPAISNSEILLRSDAYLYCLGE